MQLKLTINGVDFTPWVAEGGMTYSPLVRQSRSIVVLNGTEYRTNVQKDGWTVHLIEVRDSTLSTLSAAITSPATVIFTDRAGTDVTRTMYVTGPTYTAKAVRGGNTYYSGVSLTLEEM